MKQSSVTCARVWLGLLLAFLVIRTPFAAPAPTLPDGWFARDVGIVGTRGLSVGRGGAFILRGAGTNIGDRADSFQFAYSALTGDGEIVARVTELTTPSGEATAGVMLRDSLAANARFAFMLVSAKRGLAFERRGAVTSQITTAAAPAPVSEGVAKKRKVSIASAIPPSRHAAAATIVGSATARQAATRSSSSDIATTTAAGDEGAPYYLRLVRQGNAISAFKSADGVTWTLVGSDTIPMAATIYAGLVVNNHDLGSLATATFTAVRLTRGVPAPAPDATLTQTIIPTTAPPLPAPAAPLPPAPSAPPPADPPPSNNGAPDPGTSVAVMQWNIHHGIGTDGVLDPDRIARWVAFISPNVVSLNEVDTADLAAQLHERLEARTGKAWTAWYSGADTLLLTRLSVQATSVCTTNGSAGRMAAQVSVVAGSRSVNVWSTHLSVNSAGERLSELGALQNCARQWPEARILAGDFNMQVSSDEYNAATAAYVDAWAAARASGVTVNYDGNCDGCTRNSRIDYVFSSQGATWLTLRLAQVFDTRDANGIMPSDHKPMLVVYDVH